MSSSGGRVPYAVAFAASSASSFSRIEEWAGVHHNWTIGVHDKRAKRDSRTWAAGAKVHRVRVRELREALESETKVM